MRSPLSPPQDRDFEGVNSEGLRWLDLVRFHARDMRQITVTFDPVSVAANTTVEQTTTVTGLKSDDLVLRVIKPTHTAGLAVSGGRATADDTLGITLINVTGSPIDPGEEDYIMIYIKNSRL